MNRLRTNIRPLLIIVGISFLLISPQLFKSQMIIGSDSIFHYNRFYDTFMQMKSLNYQPFISMYGFQESARMVTPFYGSFMSYIQGGLVFLAPSWFYYQLLSNGLLYILAGWSMYAFLKVYKVSSRRSLYGSILFMTTFSIQYWTYRQGFSSWGAAILPLCLIPILLLFKNKSFPSVVVACAVSLMLQVHTFTALLLVAIYIISYIYYLFTFKVSLRIWLKQGVVSLLWFILLSLSLLYGLFYIYSGNDILGPFINKKMYLSTVTDRSNYWLVTPSLLFYLIIFKSIIDIFRVRKLTRLEKLFLSCSILFFILSSSLFPWKYLTENNSPFAEFVQFPFRFFVPFTVLFIAGFIKWLDQFKEIAIKKFNFEILFILIICLETVSLISASASNWETDSFIKTGKHTYLLSDNNQEIRESFFMRDKKAALKLVQKSTPDYVPIYEETSQNKYKLYYKNIIEEDIDYQKTPTKSGLKVSWQGKVGEEAKVPVFLYKNTKMLWNDEEVLHQDIKLSPIGTPILTNKVIDNEILITYKPPKGYLLTELIQILSWVLALFYMFKSKKELLGEKKIGK